jgi:hypothetical protein
MGPAAFAGVPAPDFAAGLAAEAFWEGFDPFLSICISIMSEIILPTLLR